MFYLTLEVTSQLPNINTVTKITDMNVTLAALSISSLIFKLVRRIEALFIWYRKEVVRIKLWRPCLGKSLPIITHRVRHMNAQ